MLINLIAIIAIVVGLVAIFMAWLASRKNQDLVKRLTGVNERVSALQTALTAEQQRVEQAKATLQAELVKLGGDPARLSPNGTEPGPLRIPEISPEALQARLDNGDELVVVDMRQLFEYKAGHIPGAINIFVNDIPMRAGELPQDKDIIFQCWHGNTSLQAAAYLIENGWSAERVASLSGGMAGWTQTHGLESLAKETL